MGDRLNADTAPETPVEDCTSSPREPYYADPSSTITAYWGDCLDVMRGMPDASVDSIVTDPPAGVRFMGRAWDSDMGGRHQWVAWMSERMAEAYRVLKPGGHGLVWALPRTSHWTAWALEDAGFEVRDAVQHLFGTGFPKSLDVGKAIDRARDEDAEPRAAVSRALCAALERSGRTRREIDNHFGTANISQYWFSPDRDARVPSVERWPWVRDFLGIGDELDTEVWRLNGRKGAPGDAWALREVTGRWSAPGRGTRSAEQAYGLVKESGDITAPATDAAREWSGWGTALKPGAETWWLVRKPLSEPTVAANVLAHGTGAINVNACRVGTDTTRGDRYNGKAAGGNKDHGWRTEMTKPWEVPAGRWPTNVLWSHHVDDNGTCHPDCAVAELDGQSGTLSSWMSRNDKSIATDESVFGKRGPKPVGPQNQYGDTGGASRYFPTFRYAPKAPKRERPEVDGRGHPTVKSQALCRWLVRLATPPGGTVLDCFAGSGAILEAARTEGFHAIGIEADEHSCKLIAKRLSTSEPTPDSEPLTLFDGEAS